MTRTSLLRAVARIACTHYRPVVLLALTLTVAALVPILWHGTTSTFNVARMLPQKIPAARAFTRAITDFGAADEAVVVFWLDPDATDESLRTVKPLADEIARRLRRRDEFNDAFCRKLAKDEKKQLLEQELPRWGLLLLDEAGIERVRKLLASREAIEASIVNANERLGQPISDEARRAVRLNLLGVAQVFRDNLQHLLGQKQEDNTYEEYLVDDDRRMLLIIAEPRYPAQNVQFSKHVMQLIATTVAETIYGSKPLTPADLPDAPRLAQRLLAAHEAESMLGAIRPHLPPEALEAAEAVAADADADGAHLRLLLRWINHALRRPEATASYLARATRHEKHFGLLHLVKQAERNELPAPLRLRLNRLVLELDAPDLVRPAEWSGLTEAARTRFRIEYGGGYEIARGYENRLNGVLLGTLATSAVGVLLFFGYFFRRYGVLAYIGAPLLMIVSWTGGVGWLLFGQLNLVSCGFAAVLIGLGVDYAVHIYNRYVEERARGLAVAEAFGESLAHTGWGVIIGMATTCCAFLALHVTRFRQLAEFGILAGVGIALSVPAMCFVLPALISWRNARKPENPRTLKPTGFLLPRIDRFIAAHRAGVALAGCAFAALCIGSLATRGVDFNKRMSTLRPRDRAFELNGEIARAFSKRNPNKLYFLAMGRDEEAALETAATYQNELDRLKDDGLVLDYDSVTRYLPPPSVQRARLDLLAEIDFERALADLKAILPEQALQDREIRFNVTLLEAHAARVKNRSLVLPSDFRGTRLGQLVRRFVAQRRQTYYLKEELPPAEAFPVTLAKDAVARDGVTRRHPAGAELTRAELLALTDPAKYPDPDQRVRAVTVYRPGFTVKSNIYLPIAEDNLTGEPKIGTSWLKQFSARLDLRRDGASAETVFDDPKVAVTGTSLLAHELAKVVKKDFIGISFWIVAICLGVLVVFYIRHPVRVIFCFMPVGLGLLFFFGIMSLLEIPFNFINVLTVPIIIGLGVDNGIHLVNRYFEEGRNVTPMVVETGRALMITALTSMIGFGSLTVAILEGLYSIAGLGLLSVLALLTVLVASLVVFPALLPYLAPPPKPETKTAGSD